MPISFGPTTVAEDRPPARRPRISFGPPTTSSAAFQPSAAPPTVAAGGKGSGGSSGDLPAGWEERIATVTTGKVYFYNNATGETRPTAPPPDTVTADSGGGGPRFRESASEPGVQSAELGGGWQACAATNVALLQVDARYYSRCLLRALRVGSHERPWAVRGDVPYEDENCNFCSVVIVGGVRMHLPEKLFGRNWFELRHGPSNLVLSFDAMGALGSW